MISRWIRETILEYTKAKNNQNTFKMIQMSLLEDALKDMRDKVLKLQ